MNELERRVQPDKRLLLLEIVTSFSALFFLIFFSLIVSFGHSLEEHKIVIITFFVFWLLIHIGVIVVSIIFLYFKNNFLSKELKERANFTYYWAMIAGYLFFVPLIIYRSFYLSGGKLKTTKKAQKDYEISIIHELYERGLKDKIVNLSLNNKNRIDDVYELYKDNFITFEERNQYMWNILVKETNIIDKYVNYNDIYVIKKVSDIIETY